MTIRFERDDRLNLSDGSYAILDQMIARGFPRVDVLRVAIALSVDDAVTAEAYAEYDRDQAAEVRR